MKKSMTTIDLFNQYWVVKLKLDKAKKISQKLKLQSYFNEFSEKTLLIDVYGREFSYETIFNDSLKLIHYFKKKGLKKIQKF